jgi:hypothetical protein
MATSLAVIAKLSQFSMRGHQVGLNEQLCHSDHDGPVAMNVGYHTTGGHVVLLSINLANLHEYGQSHLEGKSSRILQEIRQHFLSTVLGFLVGMVQSKT